MDVLEFSNPLLKAAKVADSDQLPCCGWHGRHNLSCSVYKENFDKTINQLKSLPKRSSDEETVLSHLQKEGAEVPQKIAKALGWTHEKAFTILSSLVEAGAAVKNKMRFAATEEQFHKFVVILAGSEWISGKKQQTRQSVDFYVTAISFVDGPGMKIKSLSYNKDRTKAKQFSKLLAEDLVNQINGPAFRGSARYEKA